MNNNFSLRSLLTDFSSYGILYGSSLFFSIVITRILGPSEFGIYSIVFSSLAILSTLLSFNIREGLTSALLDKKQFFDDYSLGSFISFLTTVPSLLFAIGALSASFLWFPHFFYFITCALILHFSTCFDYAEAFLYRDNKSYLIARFQFVEALLSFICICFCVFFHILLPTLICYFSVKLISRLVFRFGAAHINRKSLRVLTNLVQARNIFAYIFTYSWPHALSAFSVAVYLKIDVLILSLFVKSSTVGEYALASSICALSYSIISLFSRKVIHEISDNDSIQSLTSKLQLYRKKLLTLILLLAVVFSIAIPLSLPVVYGYSFYDSSRILVLLSFSIIPVAISSVTTCIIRLYGLDAILPKTTIICGILNIALNFLLIPAFGSYGAALATLISYSLVVPLQYCFCDDSDAKRLILFTTYLYREG